MSIEKQNVLVDDLPEHVSRSVTNLAGYTLCLFGSMMALYTSRTVRPQGADKCAEQQSIEM